MKNLKEHRQLPGGQFAATASASTIYLYRHYRQTTQDFDKPAYRCGRGSASSTQMSLRATTMIPWYQ